MLLLVSAVKLVAEIALLSLVAQGVVGLLAGARRSGNPVYRLFQVITAPFVRGVRRLAPRAVADRQVPLLAFALLGVVWAVATVFKIQICLDAGVQACR
jgi:hypothetical protein